MGPIDYNTLLKPDVNGYVSEKYLRYVLVELVRNTKLNGYYDNLTNASEFDIVTGAAEEYADYFLLQIKRISALNANHVIIEESYAAGSLEKRELIGLLSVDSKKVVDTPKNRLFDPVENIKAGLKLYEKLILKTNKLPKIDGTVSI